MDLIRDVLLVIEADDSADGWDFDGSPFPGHSEDALAYHLDLLEKQGLISIGINQVHFGGDRSIGAVRLTWPGHEFLDDIRSDTVWNKTKQTVLEKVGSVSMTVMGELARQLGRSLLGL